VRNSITRKLIISLLFLSVTFASATMMVQDQIGGKKIGAWSLLFDLFCTQIWV